MSPVRTECGMFVMCCMQCVMSESAVLWWLDVVSRGGMYMLAMVICFVLFRCTLVIWSSVLCVFMVVGMSISVNVMLFLTNVMSPPPFLCDLSFLRVV